MAEFDIEKIAGAIEEESQFINDLQSSIHKVIVGQDDLIEKLILAILADGHILLEGVPGLAKTLIIKTSYLGEFSSDFCHLKTKVIINYTSKQRYNLFRYSSTTNFYINESSSTHFAVYPCTTIYLYGRLKKT